MCLEACYSQGQPTCKSHESQQSRSSWSYMLTSTHAWAPPLHGRHRIPTHPQVKHLDSLGHMPCTQPCAHRSGVRAEGHPVPCPWSGINLLHSQSHDPRHGLRLSLGPQLHFYPRWRLIDEPYLVLGAEALAFRALPLPLGQPALGVRHGPRVGRVKALGQAGLALAPALGCRLLVCVHGGCAFPSCRGSCRGCRFWGLRFGVDTTRRYISVCACVAMLS